MIQAGRLICVPNTRFRNQRRDKSPRNSIARYPIRDRCPIPTRSHLRRRDPSSGDGDPRAKCPLFSDSLRQRLANPGAPTNRGRPGQADCPIEAQQDRRSAPTVGAQCLSAYRLPSVRLHIGHLAVAQVILTELERLKVRSRPVGMPPVDDHARVVCQFIRIQRHELIRVIHGQIPPPRATSDTTGEMVSAAAESTREREAHNDRHCARTVRAECLSLRQCDRRSARRGPLNSLVDTPRCFASGSTYQR